MMEIIYKIPQNLINFVLVTLFSLLIGLSQRRLHSQAHETDRTFGTDRTFTFFGILGFLLFLMDSENYWLFLGGGLVLAVLLSIYYFFHIRNFNDYGLTTISIALITYCLGPLTITQPHWMVLLVIVTVLVLTELKESFVSISRRFDRYEFITLAKFLIIAGVILPIIPDDPIFKDLSLTPYKIWLAVVVISTISYISYLLKKFVFKDSGIIISGILGGLYSSTATTIILAKKSALEPNKLNKHMAAIIFATAMMYLRILVLILIFSPSLFEKVWLSFAILFILSVGIGIFFLYYKDRSVNTADTGMVQDKNPLEFKVALIFTILYVAFTFITYFVITRFGTMGLNLLSLIVGLTDIDPFLINLFQGKYAVSADAIAVATLQAIISNNVLKMLYGCFFAGKAARPYLVSGFLLIIAVTIFFVFFL